jgi:predicted enzyme related to lactoylglutathione lyase
MDSVVHFEIPADDEGRARKFYSKVFGWKPKHLPEMDYTIMTTTEVGKNHMPKRPGAINGGMMKRDKNVQAPLVYMYVKSIDSSLKKVKANGGRTVMDKTHVQGKMYLAYFKDSEGNTMGLVQGMM